MKDNERRIKRGKEKEENPDKNITQKKEVTKETVICKTDKTENNDELPRLPMTISKNRDMQKMLICRLLDTGTSTTFLS